MRPQVDRIKTLQADLKVKEGLHDKASTKCSKLLKEITPLLNKKKRHAMTDMHPLTTEESEMLAVLERDFASANSELKALRFALFCAVHVLACNSGNPWCCMSFYRNIHGPTILLKQVCSGRSKNGAQ